MARKRIQIFPIFEEVRRLTADLDDAQFGRAVRHALGVYFGDQLCEEPDALVKFVSKLLLDQAARYDEFREKQRGNATSNLEQPSAANVNQPQPTEVNTCDVLPSAPPSPIPVPIQVPIQDNGADKPPAHKKFVPPTVLMVAAYCEEKGYPVDAERFVDYYTANGWRVGKNPMRDWRATVRTWAAKEKLAVAPTAPEHCGYTLAPLEDPFETAMREREGMNV